MQQNLRVNEVAGWRSLPGTIKFMLVANLLLGLINLRIAVPKPNQADAAGYYCWAQSVVGYGTIDPTKSLAGDKNYGLIHVHGRDVVLVKYPIGWSVAALPFMEVGEGMCRLCNALLGTHYRLDGVDPPVVRAAWIGVDLWATLGLLVAFSTVARFTGKGPAAFATVLVWLGTSAWAYTWKNPGMSHGLSLAFIALTYWSSLRAAESDYKRRYLVCFGACAGLVVCCRILNGVLILPAALLLFSRWASDAGRDQLRHLNAAVDGRRILRIAFFSFLGFAPMVFLQMDVWRSLYGHWVFDAYSAGGEGFAVSFGNLARFLLSSNHGLFFIHPITLISFFGLVYYWGKSSRWPWSRAFVAACLASLAATIVLYGFWHDWALGDSYGARWAADPFVLWVLGVAIVVESRKNSLLLRGALILLILPSCVLILGEMANRIPLVGRLRVYVPGKGRVYLP